MTEPVKGTITGFTGVYHADGGVRGELSYVVGKLLGRAHCGLCDITHSGISRKRAWDEMVQALGVPFELVHLNERSPRLMEATGSRSPVVVAHVRQSDAGEDDLVVVMDEAQVDDLGGRVAAFQTALRSAVKERGLQLAS